PNTDTVKPDPLPIRKFSEIGIYIIFENETKANYFISSVPPNLWFFGSYHKYRYFYGDYDFVVRGTCFPNGKEYESTIMPLWTVLQMSYLYRRYLKDRFGTDDQVYGLYRIRVFHNNTSGRFSLIKYEAVNLSYSCMSRQNFMIDLTEAR
ncbi:unnamed protein product, partial [marine sediment metagenome]